MPRQRVVVDGESVMATQSNKRVASTHLVLAIMYTFVCQESACFFFIYVFSIDVCMLFDCTSLVRV